MAVNVISFHSGVMTSLVASNLQLSIQLLTDWSLISREEILNMYFDNIFTDRLVYNCDF